MRIIVAEVILGSLAEKITGQMPIVRITDESGNSVNICPGMTAMVIWPAESSMPPAETLEPSNKQRLPLPSLCDIQQSPREVAGH